MFFLRVGVFVGAPVLLLVHRCFVGVSVHFGLSVLFWTIGGLCIGVLFRYRCVFLSRLLFSWSVCVFVGRVVVCFCFSVFFWCFSGLIIFVGLSFFCQSVFWVGLSVVIRLLMLFVIVSVVFGWPIGVLGSIGVFFVYRRVFVYRCVFF